jgi:hypothetical protein
VVGGHTTDIYSEWRARRHRGVFEPESRLHLLLFPSVCVPLGLVLFGFGVQKHLSWGVLFVAYGCINVGLTGVANIGMTYVMDSYYPVAADALLMINGLKNVVAFGFTDAVIPWITASGYEKVCEVPALIGGSADRHVDRHLAPWPESFWELCYARCLWVVFGRRIRHFTSSHWRLVWWQSH